MYNLIQVLQNRLAVVQVEINVVWQQLDENDARERELDNQELPEHHVDRIIVRGTRARLIQERREKEREKEDLEERLAQLQLEQEQARNHRRGGISRDRRYFDEL